MKRWVMQALSMLAMWIFAGCTTSPQPTPILTATPIPSPTPTATPVPPTLWFQPGIPSAIVTNVSEVLTRAGYVISDTADSAAVRVVLDPGSEATLTAQWVYALVAPFPTVPDGIALQDFQRYWQGNVATLPGFETPPQIITTQNRVDWLTARFGAIGASTPITLVEDAPASQLVDLAWNARPSISLVPFDQLEPRWKVLTIDSQSSLDKALDMSNYPLTLRVGVIGQNEAGVQAVTLLQSSGAWPATNRDPSKLTVIVMTGVTALTRATAYFMEVKGVNYPAEKIMPFFADADILHTSNEVSFTPKCPPPELTGDETFCSNPKYIELLKTIGLDVVELTGNHNNDYGTAPSTYSLDVYDQSGIAHYGGGRDLADATAPRILTAPDGTRVAFVGCNSAGPYKAWATESTPGAAPCGDWSGIHQTINSLKANNQADVVIATVQYNELPQYSPSDDQRGSFESLAAAGADIVSGSQAHQPMGFGFASGKFIHFGVGNLFFDQMDFTENRQMFADKYILYQGRPISAVLFTGMMEDYSQPRPMTSEERVALLKLIFEASGW